MRRALSVSLVIVAMVVVSGCGAKGESDSALATDAVAPASEPGGGVGTGGVTRLALGTMQLEGTEDAVTPEQAERLLPLWKALQSGSLRGTAEQDAVLKQIRGEMTEAQLTAIDTMGMMSESWQPAIDDEVIEPGAGDGQGPVGGVGRGLGGAGGLRPGANLSQEERAEMRERFQNLSEEERAELRAQFAQQAGGGARPGAAAGGPIAAVISLLQERSGQSASPPRRRGLVAAGDAAAPADTQSTDPAPTEAPTEVIVMPEPTPAPTETRSAPASENADADTQAADGATPTVVTVAQPAPTEVPIAADSIPALAQVPDENPGPPFSVEISLNRAEPSPLLEGLSVYKVTGLVRNDGDQVYAVNRVNVTFYDADGFRGALYPFPGRRYGEWIEHGAMEADFDCMLLAPGEACPFTAEIAAYNMGSFYVHADAVVAEWREPVPVEIQSTSLVGQGSNVRITGTIYNPNEYAIKNVVVNPVLIDGNGAITSMGSAYYVQSIAPGASVAFAAMVQFDTYATYQVYAQAEGDFK